MPCFAFIGFVLALLLSVFSLLLAFLLTLFSPLLAFLGFSLSLFLTLLGFFLAFAFTLFCPLLALFLALLSLLLALFNPILAGLFLGLLGILLSLLGSLIGSLGRVFTPLVAEVAFFLLLPLGLLDGVLLGYLGDASQFALVFLYLLDAVVDFLLTLLLGFLTSLGFALQLLEVLFLGTFLSLALLVAEGCLGSVANR